MVFCWRMFVSHIITRQFWNIKCRWFMSKLTSFVERVPCGAYVTYKSFIYGTAPPVWQERHMDTSHCVCECAENDLRWVYLYNYTCITLSNDDVLETEYRLVAAGDWRMRGQTGYGYRRMRRGVMDMFFTLDVMVVHRPISSEVG